MSYASRVRLERLKAAQPLRPGGWRLTRDGGGGEVALGIGVALAVRAGAVVLGQEAAAAKLFLHEPDRTLQHLAHLAALQVAERLPDEIGALLVVGAIESDQVQMRVERRSDEVRCRTVTEPVFAPLLPSLAARSA